MHLTSPGILQRSFPPLSRATGSAEVDEHRSVEGGRSFAHLITPFTSDTNSYSGVQIAHARSLLQNGHFARNEKRPGVSEVIYMALMTVRAAARVWGRIHQLLIDHVTGPRFCLQEMAPDKLLLCNFIPHTGRLTALHMHLNCLTSSSELNWSEKEHIAVNFHELPSEL